jgi:histidinol-phosphate/aromatic aminotransferase/cobyric acid decarboxylase-like protein/ribosomal protein S18 acetylase RimI-like enzyme
MTWLVPLAAFAQRRQALRIYAILVMMRSVTTVCTILPALQVPNLPLNLISGHSRDLVFSGHAAFVASWVLQNPTAFWIAYGFIHGLATIAARHHYTVDVVLAWMTAYLVMRAGVDESPVVLRLLGPLDTLTRLQTRVWTRELAQYRVPKPETGPTCVAVYGKCVVGYIGIVAPHVVSSIDQRSRFTRAPDEYEIRALTVDTKFRRRGIASGLMFAAMRYVEADGGTRIIIQARRELLGMYRAFGFAVDPSTFQVGNVAYHIARADIVDIRAHIGTRRPSGLLWDLPFDSESTSPCFHGGGGLDLAGGKRCIQADVLDAWYPPAPNVVSAVSRDLARHMHVTPPTGSPELVHAIATSRGIDPKNIIIGAGSSDLIYRYFLTWLSPKSRVLLLDPTYGEYAHILGIIKCDVTRFPLTNHDIDLQALCAESGKYDLAVLVNPNSPTGRWADIAKILPHMACTVWIDETYIEYAGDVSVEAYAASSRHVVVCKSMSKIYALSGMRLAYACGSPIHFDSMRARTPPWNVSRLAQIAGVEAISTVAKAYYAARIKETKRLREMMMEDLARLGMKCIPGCANFVMARLPKGTCARAFVQACERRGVAIRTVHGDEYIRVAVKDSRANGAMVRVFREVSRGATSESFFPAAFESRPPAECA